MTQVTGRFRVGDVVRLKAGGPHLVVTLVTRSLSGVVMIGCVPMRETEDAPDALGVIESELEPVVLP